MKALKPLSKIKKQDAKKRVMLCQNKQGESKIFKVYELSDIPLAWGEKPLMLGYDK